MRKIYSLILFGFLLGGFSCRSAPSTIPLTERLLDAGLRVAVALPTDWQVVQLNPLMHDLKSGGGFAYISGASAWGLGPETKNGEVAVKIEVVVVPRLQAAEYEKNKEPANAVRKGVSGDLVVFGAVIGATSTEAEAVLNTIKFK